MDAGTMERAADWLAAARLSGRSVAGMPEELRPSTTDEGNAIQRRVHSRLIAAGRGKLVGWKVGATTLPMQRLLNMSEPVAGAIFSSGEMTSPATLRHADYQKPGVECEVCVRMKSPLPVAGEQVDRASAAAAIGTMCASIEVVDNRYGEFARMGAPLIIADDMFQAAVVLGTEIQDWQKLDLIDCVGTTTADGVTKLEGRGGDVMGHPFESLVWLANFLGARGERLEPGQIVMTGSLTLPYWTSAGERIQTRIDGLGAVNLNFV